MIDSHKHPEFRINHSPQSADYRACSITVMDTSDPRIQFNSQGESQFVSLYRTRAAQEIKRGDLGRKKFEDIVAQIRKSHSRNALANCICGVSGGVDSSLVLLRAVQAGLRPLAVHMDNGWNNELAVANIERLTKSLGVELHTDVLDWESFRGLQRAFFRASVPNVEMVTDHAINATLFKLSAKFGLRHIITGSNLATEAFLPTNSGHDNKDWLHIKSIHQKFSDTPLNSYPKLNRWQFAYSIFLRRVRFIPILNYLNYDRDAAKAELIATCGWRDYGRKHGESSFTRFFQEYYLPVKFGVDKRRAHLSCQILAGHITREQALQQLQQPLWESGELEPAIDFVCRKLGFDRPAWEEIMAAQPLSHRAYGTDWAFRSTENRVYQAIRKIATGR